jgi:hemoglobin
MVTLRTSGRDGWVPTPEDTPYHRLGGSEGVRALVQAFYDAMEATEPALTRLHRLDEQGRVSAVSRERLSLFFIGWLGGPQDYTERHGHPRLRMRHGRVPVDVPTRDAWLRCMRQALDAREVQGEARAYLDGRLAEVADFLRNVPSPLP